MLLLHWKIFLRRRKKSDKKREEAERKQEPGIEKNGDDDEGRENKKAVLCNHVSILGSQNDTHNLAQDPCQKRCDIPRTLERAQCHTPAKTSSRWPKPTNWRPRSRLRHSHATFHTHGLHQCDTLSTSTSVLNQLSRKATPGSGNWLPRSDKPHLLRAQEPYQRASLWMWLIPHVLTESWQVKRQGQCRPGSVGLTGEATWVAIEWQWEARGVM